MEVVACPNCGEENPARFRLCGFCGTALATSLPAGEVRKPATFIFVDLKGSTALTERIDQEAMSEIKKRYFTVMAAQIERHGGTVEKYIGDAIMAVFGIPRAHEDDALRAVRAAYGMQQELTQLNEEFLRFYGVELANRTGVNTGEVVANTDPTANQQLATGDTVNVAARLEQAAPENEILIGETTYDLVRRHVEVEAVEPLELKGKSERVAAFRVVRLREVASGVLQEAPLVGRDREWAELEGSYQRAVDEAACRLATVIGDPGVGKSRLVKEFTGAHAERATILPGRCLPYGEGITFWPLAEVARAAAGIVDEDSTDVALAKVAAMMAPAGPDAAAIVERVTSILGLTPSQFPVSELFWGGRRMLETLASERPVVIVIDDIHLAESTLLDFLEHAVTVSLVAPILILCTARHTLLEQHADWSERTDSPVVILERLSAEDSGGLVDQLLGGAGLDGETRSRIVQAADGNPLFVEQMVSMLVDKELLRQVDGHWVPTRDMSAVAVPPTIQALLAARLDDLSREERAVVEPAAVIGLVFFRPAVEEMVPQQVRQSVPGLLGALDDKQFVALDQSDPEDESYRFRHGLIRDATYGSLLKRNRAQLHERFVAWAEVVNRERGREQEFEEILGFHLEQAYRYRTELGPLDDVGRSLAERGATKLGAAGRRAFARGDLPAAISLLRRAGALLPPDDPVGIDTRTELGEALSEGGEFAEGGTVLDTAHAAAVSIGDLRLATRARLARISLELYSEEMPPGAFVAALSEAEAAIGVFRAAVDVAGEARSTRIITAMQSTIGRYDLAAAAAEQTAESALRAGDSRLASRAAAAYAATALYGPTPVREVRDRCERLLEQVTGDRKAEARILAAMAIADAMLGDIDDARAGHRRAKAILAELGISVVSASTSIEGARIEMLAGDVEAAEVLLRADDAELARLGERYFRSTVVGLLANVLEAQGKLEEAEAYLTLTLELADEADANSQVLARLVRAKLDAREGLADDAIAAATEALELADTTADIDFQGEVHADFGLVLTRLDRLLEARTQYELALSCYERKGDLTSAASVRSVVESMPRLPEGAR
jgi:class 3 adenylate cyclase/tetratricopeptide (TPR) repeat protein